MKPGRKNATEIVDCDFISVFGHIGHELDEGLAYDNFLVDGMLSLREVMHEVGSDAHHNDCT